MANNKKEIKEIESEVKETFKKKKIIKIIIAVIILIAILVFIFFFLNFKVTFKYNNSEEDKEIKVKFLRKIPTSEVKEDITKDFSLNGLIVNNFVEKEKNKMWVINKVMKLYKIL